MDARNEQRTFDGEIVMSDEIARSGRGYYVRSDAPDAFGFYEVEVINDDRILVIETWAKSDEERHAIVSGYVWERV